LKNLESKGKQEKDKMISERDDLLKQLTRL
jgi:hypothetical protein